MSAPDVEILCTPADGILAISADTIAALDRLGNTLPPGTPWQVEVLIGHTTTDTVRLTARAAMDPEPDLNEAA